MNLTIKLKVHPPPEVVLVIRPIIVAPVGETPPGLNMHLELKGESSLEKVLPQS